MKLQTFLNKCVNSEFMISVTGWCEEMPFSNYEEEKKQPYWKYYKNCEIKKWGIITTNDKPELWIDLK